MTIQQRTRPRRDPHVPLDFPFSDGRWRLDAHGDPLAPTSLGRPASQDRWRLPVPGARTGDRPASFLARLRERKVCAWMISYLAVSWVVLQLMDVLADIWFLSLAVQQTTSLALALGLLPALVVTWYHGERGRQRMCVGEVLLLAVTLLASGVTLWSFYTGTAAVG